MNGDKIMFKLIICPECESIIKYNKIDINTILDIKYNNRYEFTSQYKSKYELEEYEYEYELYLDIKNGKHQWCPNCCSIIDIDEIEEIELDGIVGCGFDIDEFTLCTECKYENNPKICKKIQLNYKMVITNYDLYNHNVNKN